MKTYDVTITATVTKTLRVQAENDDDAIEMAHRDFSINAEEGLPEKYDQHTDGVREVK